MTVKDALYNIDSLLLLERLLSRSVDLVYFDPPWPYPEDNLEEYLLFLARRIQQAHRALSEKGNFFIHLPPHLMGRVCVLIEQIFKKGGFRNQYILPFPPRRSFVFSRSWPDYSALVLYAKSDSSVYNHLIQPRADEDISRFYRYNDERGRYRLVSLFVSGDRPSLKFDWNGITPPQGRYWRYSEEKLKKLEQEDLISFNVSRKIPSLKQYLKDTGVPISSIWSDLLKPLSKDENTGYSSQQDVELLKRVIKIGSNPGDMVLDPFCGSGTTLVAAHVMERHWIGSDISNEAFEIASRRLTAVENGKTEYRSGDTDEVLKDFPQVFRLEEPRHIVRLWSVRTEDVGPRRQDIVKPLIITEGKTDWKHLKAAYLKLKEIGDFSEEFDIDFHEYDDIEMGDAELLKTCVAHSKLPQTRRHIFIFDRDKDDIVKNVSTSTHYKDWGNDVFSFAIPIPAHRLETPKVSIELYYTDEDLKKKDEQGRRLFLSNEFDPHSGIHNSCILICQDSGRLRGDLKIIDNKVFDLSHNNVAMTKNDFANNIINARRSFSKIDVYEFRKIFEIIEEITKLAS